MNEVVSSFLASADAFCRLAERDEVAARWADQSSLVGYTVGGLVGHVAAGVGWLEPLLEGAPPTDATPITFSAYCIQVMVGAPQDLDRVHAFAREQGERGAQRGHREALARLRGRIDRLQVLLDKEDGDRLLDLRPMVPAAIPLDEFIRTRVVELVVHGDDLAASVGVTPWQPGVDAAELTIDVLMAVARQMHGDVEVIRALCRRERATPGVIPVL